MRKVTGSNIVVWKSNKGNYFNVKIETLEVLLTVHQDKQPKSFAKLQAWFDSNDELVINPIVFSE
ncbi:hypothetical protein V7152_23535 [Neobacillus drentensis]|uniref:hypothetical protein n=1 Tax=Neobacillus drentensis TaxID=220684 RepID=UPI003000E1F4